MEKMSEGDSRIYKNAEAWTDKLADQIEKEFVSIPDVIIAQACIKALGRAVRRSSVLTPAAALKLVSNTVINNFPAPKPTERN
jgi:hypothetical protein